MSVSSISQIYLPIFVRSDQLCTKKDKTLFVRELIGNRFAFGMRKYLLAIKTMDRLQYLVLLILPDNSSAVQEDSTSVDVVVESSLDLHFH